MKHTIDNMIQKRPLIVSQDECKTLSRVPLSEKEFQEEWMQKLLQSNPQLLPIAEIDSVFAPIVCIGREVPTSAGFIDNLYISPKGYITIVETKLWRNPEARREVVGQVLDYAKEFKQFSYENIDRYFQQYYLTYYNKKTTLFNFMVKENLLDLEDETLFIDLVEKNLRNARFLLLIVGDGIREGVWRMAKFLNETPNMLYTLALVELEVYNLPNNERLIVPNLLLQTNNIERGVFRFENGQAVPIIMDERESEPDIPVSAKRISIEDFSKALKESNPDIEESEFHDFIRDLEELGYIITNSGKRDLVIKYPIAGSKQALNVMHLSSDKKVGAFKYIGTLERDLGNRGFSEEIAKAFYDSLSPYQLPSSKSNSLNYDINCILRDKGRAMPAFEKVASYF